MIGVQVVVVLVLAAIVAAAAIVVLALGIPCDNWSGESFKADGKAEVCEHSRVFCEAYGFTCTQGTGINGFTGTQDTSINGRISRRGGAGPGLPRPARATNSANAKPARLEAGCELGRVMFLLKR